MKRKNYEPTANYEAMHETIKVKRVSEKAGVFRFV